MDSRSLDDFQTQVSELLLRHRSVLDVLSKVQESASRINRSLTKAITECGCVEVVARKQMYDSSKSLEEQKKLLDTHFNGSLCEHCREVVMAELGKNMFYVAALCNIADLKLEDVIAMESERLHTLGVFNLS